MILLRGKRSGLRILWINVKSRHFSWVSDALFVAGLDESRDDASEEREGGSTETAGTTAQSVRGEGGSGYASLATNRQVGASPAGDWQQKTEPIVSSGGGGGGSAHASMEPALGENFEPGSGRRSSDVDEEIQNGGEITSMLDVREGSSAADPEPLWISQEVEIHDFELPTQEAPMNSVSIHLNPTFHCGFSNVCSVYSRRLSHFS